MFKYFFQGKNVKYHIWAALSVIMMMLASALEIGKAYVYKTIIDFASNNSVMTFQELLWLSLFFLLVIFVIHLLRGTVTFRLKSKIRYALREDVLSAICLVPSEVFNKKYGVSKAISIFNNDIEIIVNSYFTSVFNIVYMLSSICFAVLAIVQMNAIYLVVIFIGCVAIYGFMKYFKSRLSDSQKGALDRMESVVFKVKNYAENHFAIKSNQIKFRVNQDFQSENSEHANKLFQFNFLSNVSRTLNETLSSAILISIYVLSAYLVMNQEITIGEMVFVVQLAISVVTPILGFSNIINHINSTKKVRMSLQELVAYGDQKTENDILKSVEEISIRKLKYSYETNPRDGLEKPILSIDSFTFKKGKKYLIRGESGSGKSTFIKLLSKQLSGHQGEIFIDNTEIRNLSESQYFNKVRVVNQAPELFNFSVESNIAMDKSCDRQNIKRVLSQVNLLELVDNLEYGLQTELNSDSIQVSGGEMQRLMIARALYSDADFLILDEPFSALDAENKSAIEKSITSLQDKGIIVVSHYLDEETENLYDEVLDFNASIS